MAEKYYKVAESDLVAIADRTRAMANITEPLSISEIIYWLGRVVYIPQANGTCEMSPNFYTSASTLVPDVQTTTGINELVLNLITSLTGEIV